MKDLKKVMKNLYGVELEDSDANLTLKETEEKYGVMMKNTLAYLASTMKGAEVDKSAFNGTNKIKLREVGSVLWSVIDNGGYKVEQAIPTITFEE